MKKEKTDSVRRPEQRTDKTHEKQLIPLLESYKDEPVMVTVTFGEGRDAGKQS